jgi:putative aldouronate transport system permease protein
MKLKGKKAKSIIQTATTFPNFISWVLVFSVFFIFLSVDDGYVNELLLGIGIIKEPLNLLATEKIVWPLQLFISNWKSVGFSSIIYLAAIAGIDPGLYESVEIDGGGRLAKIIHITIPGITATFFVLVLLGIGNILSTGFEQYYLFYNHLVSDKILVLDVYLYNVGIGMNQFSMSTALGMAKTIISLILLFSANALSKAVRGTPII